MDRVTKAEKRFMAEVLVGPKAAKDRPVGGALVLEAAHYSFGEEEILEEEAIDRVRRAMAGQPTNFVPATRVQSAAEAWRRVQVRQLFRLALEAFFYRIIQEIGKGPKPTEALVTNFLAQCTARPERRTAAEWLKPGRLAAAGPVEFMARIKDKVSRSASVREVCANSRHRLAFSRHSFGSPGMIATLMFRNGHSPCSAAQSAHSKVKAVNSRMTGCLSAPTNRVAPLHFLQLGPGIRSRVMTSTVNIDFDYTPLFEDSQEKSNIYLHNFL